LTVNDRIEINPRVCGGQPVIKGTRVSVSAILEQLANGESVDSVMRGFPELTKADVLAAVRYAADSFPPPSAAIGVA
jgi:uncharacterized protein (DUF433 family)